MVKIITKKGIVAKLHLYNALKMFIAPFLFIIYVIGYSNDADNIKMMYIRNNNKMEARIKP